MVLTLEYIRRAEINDVVAVTAIYNQGIAERSSTFETKPKTVEDRSEWIQAQSERHPILVYELNSEVVGWASISTYRPRDCYIGVGEFSIYLHNQSRGKGIGKALLNALIKEAEQLGYWKLSSRIFDFNVASRNLCKSCGFREVGIYEKHSKLEGQWIDCVVVEKLIENNLAIIT